MTNLTSGILAQYTYNFGVTASLHLRLRPALARGERVVFLTGAGISAESGIPTFRGEEGYWTVGSRVYHPQEMATQAAFRTMPDDLWAWYLYRRTTCRRAQPNGAHQALVELERALGDRFLLVTQNVDGLHLRAGNSMQRTYQIHGNIDFMRCVERHGQTIVPLPDDLPEVGPAQSLPDEIRARLVCPECGELARPHVLWFDEYYDEQLYRFESSLEAAASAAVLVTVGTSGSTNLPNMMAELAARTGKLLIDINPDENRFSTLAERAGGIFLAGPASERVPELARAISAMS